MSWPLKASCDLDLWRGGEGEGSLVEDVARTKAWGPEEMGDWEARKEKSLDGV